MVVVYGLHAIVIYIVKVTPNDLTGYLIKRVVCIGHAMEF